MRAKTDILVVGPGRNEVTCTRCTKVEKLPLPMLLSAFPAYARYLRVLHKNCQPKAVEVAS